MNMAGAVGLCSLNEIQRLLPHITEVGDYLRTELESVQNDFPAIIDRIQGMGLMQGIVFAGDASSTTGAAVYNLTQTFRGMVLYSQQSFGEVITCPGGEFGDDFNRCCYTQEIYIDGFFSGLAYTDLDNQAPLTFNVIRVSPSYYTTTEQIDCYITALRDVLTNLGSVQPAFPLPSDQCPLLQFTLIPPS